MPAIPSTTLRRWLSIALEDACLDHPPGYRPALPGMAPGPTQEEQ